MAQRLSRRHVLRAAGVAGAGLVLGAGTVHARPVDPGEVDSGGGLQPQEPVENSDPKKAAIVPFHGAHQAGIVTPTQDHLHFAAFDVLASSAREVRELLRIWSDAAERMCAGKPVGEYNYEPLLPPEDTGEALGRPTARLTITFGFGPSLFVRDGTDRFGLLSRRPAPLQDIPPMPGDALRPELSGGDICVQACADDPQVAFHAVRNLGRLARGVAQMRWSQLGFGRAARTTHEQQTPRNLFGFKDGTNNLDSRDDAQMSQHVWVGGGDGPEWMHGGTYLVARRIRMHIETWDNSSLDDQEKSIGRHKLSGAPIGTHQESDPVNLKARTPDGGQPMIPVNSHVRLAHDGTERILRRSYNYTDGMDLETGELDAGLFFICFQRDPRSQFVPMQRRLAANDALNEYITHTSSAVFACPPGAREGGYVGESLFESA